MAGFVPGTRRPAVGGGDVALPDAAFLGVDDRVRELSESQLDVGVDVGSSDMMRPIGDAKMYLHRAPIDVRGGRNGLAALVREGMWQVRLHRRGCMFFVGRRHDMLKVLSWDRNGCAIWTKKIETDEKFHWLASSPRGRAAHPPAAVRRGNASATLKPLSDRHSWNPRLPIHSRTRTAIFK